MGCFTISFEARAVGGIAQASDWIFLAAVLVATAQVLVRRDDVGKTIPFGIVAGFLTYVASTAVSVLLRGELLSSAIGLAQIGFLAIPWLWVGCIVLRNETDVRAAVFVWGLGLAVSGAAALAQFFFGDIIAGVDYPAITRMTGLTRHANNLGGAIAVAAAPVLFVSGMQIGGGRWMLGVGIVGLCMAGLLLSGSVGGMLATVSAFASWLLFTRRMSLRTGLGVALLVIAVFVVSDVLERHGVNTPVRRVADEVLGDKGSPSLDLRKDAAKFAWDKIKKHPFVGEGSGRAGTRFEGHAQHNIILAFWLDSGLFGMLGILAIFASAGLQLARELLRVGRGPAADFTAALGASMVGMFVFMQSAPLVFVRHAWMPIGLAVALSYRRRRSIEGQQALRRRVEPTGSVRRNGGSDAAGRLAIKPPDPQG